MPDADAQPSASPFGSPPAASRHNDGPLTPGATAAFRSWLEAERGAIAARAAGAAVRTSAEDRQVLRQACDETRRRGAHVEQLIILVKRLWGTLPPPAATGDDRSAGWRDGEREALEQVVRVCIEEFYDAARAGDGDGTSPPDGASTRT